MPPWLIGVLVEGAIPFVGGVYATLLAFRLVGPKPGVNPKQDDWHRKWGGFMRVGGPLLAVFAVFLWAKGIVSQPGSALTPANVWVRHKTTDGAVSVEFPAPPTTVTKAVEGGTVHNVTLSQKESDRHFILSWSEIAPIDGVTDEERLDEIRKSMPAIIAQQGRPLVFVSEEKFTEGDIPGRLLVFDASGKYTMRMKCLILKNRLYRATATTPRTPQDEADGVQFVNSFRLEKSVR